MKKEFQEWHKEKSDIHHERVRPFFHERELWFVSLGVNVGFEEDGKGKDFLRPVLVLKKFNNQSFWGIPVTKRIKAGKYYFPFNIDGRGQNNLILSQLRLMDAKRMQYKIGLMDKKEFSEVKQKLKLLIA